MSVFRALRASASVLRILVVSLFLVFSAQLGAVEEGKPLHYSAERQVWNRKENKIELFSKAMVKQMGEVLTADYIMLDMEARTLDARGNCVYIASDTIIYGEEMRFNLDSRTGSILSGRVSNDRFSLAGERINKLGNKRFQTHWGEYSTCWDCPQSWTFTAEDVDMQIEGYAYMSNVTTKIKDAPVAWFPYMVLPMKTQRQTGLLFPTFGVSDLNGFQFVLPFFWAINRSADMTFGFGDYSKKGPRFQWEGRYALSDRSRGTANFYYLRDASPIYNEKVPHRWALNVEQTQELPFGIDQKLRLIEMSDNRYPVFVGDIPGKNEAAVASDLIFSYASSEVSSFLAAKRYRNLLNTDPNPDKQLKEFDPRTVQPLPMAMVTSNDQFIPGTPVSMGLSLGAVNFTRTSSAYDYDETSVPFGTNPFADGGTGPDMIPGVDPVRKATRVSVVPSLYTTLRPLDVLSVVPSVKYYSYFYSFHNRLDNLNRGYLLFQSDLSTQLERVFDQEDESFPKLKHLIRPSLTYSYIPYVKEDSQHPFLRQINRREGYNFDNYDIVPLDSSPSNVNYFVPLGNSISYGFTSQLIRKRMKALEPSYERSIELSANHAINFRDHQKPLSRFNSNLNFSFDQFLSNTEYSFLPYTIRPHTFTTSATYIVERGVHERVLTFDRSMTVNYSYNPSVETSNITGSLAYSLSDYILPSFFASYVFDKAPFEGGQGSRFLNSGMNIQFQSPSRCWRFAFGITRDLSTGLSHPWDFSLNLTGSGFGGFTDYATQAGVYKEGGI